MREIYREVIREAEQIVRVIKDRDLKREAFGVLLARMLSNGGMDHRNGKGISRDAAKNKIREGSRIQKIVNRPGRRGGGIATEAVQRLIVSGYFRKGHDAAAVMHELTRKRVPLEASQLRMILLRFSRNGKLKRRIKMKGEKVTYLYSTK